MNDKQKQNKHWAVYKRVSTDKQDCQMQQDAIDRFLASLPEDQRPTSIVEFTDEGISGAKNDRPAFQEMLAAAFGGAIDTIVVYKLDRFSRDASTAIVTLIELDKAGVAFVSATEKALNLGHNIPFRTTILSVFAELAQIERETIVARIKDGLASAKAKGTKLGRKYQIQPKSREAIKNAFKEIGNVKAVARRFHVSRGAVYKIIAEETKTQVAVG